MNQQERRQLELIIAQLGEVTTQYVAIVTRPPYKTETYMATDRKISEEEINIPGKDGMIPLYQEERETFLESLKRRLHDYRRPA